MADGKPTEFTAYYLQRATQEFAEDLDKVRTADDFKPDSVPLLVHALQQGTALFATKEKARVAEAKARPEADDSPKTS